MLKSFLYRFVTVIVLALALVSCHGNGNLDGNPGPSSNTVAIEDNFFSPETLTVSADTTVVWTHRGNNQHTVTSGSPTMDTGLLFDSPFLTSGQQFQFTFNQTGTVIYFCRVHGLVMTGTIIVR